ncbi:MAG: WD40 repeat domain-containing protein, partial [Waterburya sp.]
LLFEPYTSNRIQSLTFSPDGQYLASGSMVGNIQIWPVHWKSALEIACNRIKNHPVFQTHNPPEKTAQEAKKVCEKYIWKLN